eukprot:GHVH01006064.1.p1 GENE.GHVH01006064.1~~GHVH01006064.1.p1  ORF type:complete len:235 (-),score=39.48 GHVH01006064.1:114-818(-)
MMQRPSFTLLHPSPFTGDSVVERTFTTAAGDVNKTPPCMGYTFTNNYYEASLTDEVAVQDHYNWLYDLKSGNTHVSTLTGDDNDSVELTIKGTPPASYGDGVRVRGLTVECELFFVTNNDGAEKEEWLAGFLKDNDATVAAPRCVHDGYIEFTTFVKECSCEGTSGDYVDPNDTSDERSVALTIVIDLAIVIAFLAFVLVLYCFYKWWTKRSAVQHSAPVDDDREAEWDYYEEE